MSAPEQSGTPCLVRWHDRRGRLQYVSVGVIPDVEYMRRAHQLLWRFDACPARLEYEEFDTVEDAEAAERRALRDEQPRSLTFDETCRVLTAHWSEQDWQRFTDARQLADREAVEWIEQRSVT